MVARIEIASQGQLDDRHVGVGMDELEGTESAVVQASDHLWDTGRLEQLANVVGQVRRSIDRARSVRRCQPESPQGRRAVTVDRHAYARQAKSVRNPPAPVNNCSAIRRSGEPLPNSGVAASGWRNGLKLLGSYAARADQPHPPEVSRLLRSFSSQRLAGPS